MDKLDEQIISMFKEISRRLQLLHKEVSASLNLNAGFCKAIGFLDVKNGMSQTELAEICSIDKPATSRLVEKMISENFIERVYKYGNKKVFSIKLTNKGKDIAKQIKTKILSIREKYFKSISASDKQTLLNLLENNLFEGGNNA